MTVSRETLCEGKQVECIPVDLILRSPYQPRRKFDKGKLSELAESILANDLLQPITVRKIPTGEFELIAGERRWRAFQIAGLDCIPAIVLCGVSDQLAAELCLLENICRVDINPIEQAEGFMRLNTEFMLSKADIAVRVGCDRSKVSNTIRLLELPEEVQNLIASGELSSTHGKLLLSTKALELPLNTIIQLANQCSLESWSSRYLEKKINTPNKQPDYTVDRDIKKLEQALSDELCIPVTISFSQSTHQSTLTFQLDSLSIMQGLLKRLDFDYNEFS